MLIIDRLERLRPNSLHIPQVEELVGGHFGLTGSMVVSQAVGIDVDRGAVGVLHASARRVPCGK